MMDSVERVQQMLSKAEGQQQYLDWYKDETTQMLLAAARELAHPRMELIPDASHALQDNGRTIGAYEIIDFLSSPQRTSGLEEVKRKSGDRLKPTYGSAAIIKENQYEKPTTNEQ